MQASHLLPLRSQQRSDKEICEMELYGSAAATGGRRRGARGRPSALQGGGRRGRLRRPLDPLATSLQEDDGTLGTYCIYEAESPEAHPRARREGGLRRRRDQRGRRHRDRPARPGRGVGRDLGAPHRQRLGDLGPARAERPPPAAAWPGRSRCPRGHGPPRPTARHAAAPRPRAGGRRRDCGRAQARTPTTSARRRPGTKRSPPRRRAGPPRRPGRALGQERRAERHLPVGRHEAEESTPRGPASAPAATASTPASSSTWRGGSSISTRPPRPRPARSAASRASGRSPPASRARPRRARRRRGAARPAASTPRARAPVTHGQAVSPSWKRAPAA